MFRWGLVLELVGFLIIGVFGNILLTYKLHFGSRWVKLLEELKDWVNRLLNKANKKTFKWFTEADRLTVSLLIFGTVIYFVGILLKAIYNR